MNSCSTAIVIAKSIQQDLPLKASRFSQALLQERCMSKWWLTYKVGAWNFTENKLLKLVNSLKVDVLFAHLNLNIIIYKKKRQKKARFTDDARSTEY